MDTMKYSLNREEMQGLKELIQKNRKYLVRKLRESGLPETSRLGLTAPMLYQMAYQFVVNDKSLREVSSKILEKYNLYISHVSCKNWLEKIAESFLQFADDLTAKVMKKSGLPREFAIDATNLSVAGTKEIIRLHTLMHLKSGVSPQTVITDHHTAESATHIQIEKDALYLADRAYGHAKDMAHVMEHGGNFLFRISLTQIRLYIDKDCKIKLNTKKLLKKKKFSRKCYFRYKKKTYVIRLVGGLLPPERQEEAQERARKKAKKQRKQIQEITLQQAKWLILATTSEKVSRKKFLEKYRERWQIEKFFKRGKSGFKFRKIPRSKVSSGNGKMDYPTMAATLWIAFVKICAATVYEKIASLSENISLFFVLHFVKEHFS